MNPTPNRPRRAWPRLIRSGLSSAALAATLGLAAAPAWSAGTAAGTTINNRATLTFSVGGVAQTGVESSPTGNTTPGTGAGASTSFVVDRKIDLTVTTLDVAVVPVSPGATAQVTRYRVTNLGNATQDFGLTAQQEANGTAITLGGSFTDNFDTTGCIVRADGNANGTYEAVSDTAAFVDELAADANRVVFAVCNVPAGTANASVSVVSMVAQALAGGAAGTQGAVQASDSGTADVPGTVQTVFGDAAGSDDAAGDGRHSSRSAYRVISALLTVAKTQTLVCDPFSGTTNPKNIPGAIIRYAITVSNAAGAGASASLTQVTDAIDASLAFDPNFVTGSTAAGCNSATGTPTSLAGRGFRLTCGGTTTRPCTTASFLTSSAADTDGGAFTAPNATANYSQALPAGTFGANTYTAGELKPGETVTLEFQVVVQ